MAKLSALLFLLITFTVSTHGSLRCRYNQFIVENVLGSLSCIDCFPCNPGYGLSPQCGDYVKYGTKLECQPCQHGKTYSPRHDIGSCRPCGLCADHQNVIRNCTLESNSKCNHSCSSEFYYEKRTGDCKPCSFCCSDGKSIVKDQCKDMPFYKQCDANEIGCQLKCQDDQYLVVTRKGAHCENCKNCPTGSSLSPPCGRIVESINDMKCLKCTEGKTFSDKLGKEPCKVCSTCSVGQKELIPCNLMHDRVCGECDEGFYNVTSTECKPCSACCDDDYDVRVAECVGQNMPENKQCSYTQRAIDVCQQKNGKAIRPIIQNKSPAFIVVVAIGIGIITAITVLVLLWYLKYQRCKRSRGSRSSSQSLDRLVPSLEEVEPQSHSITLEDLTAHGSQMTLSFDKSVQFSDAQSFFDDAQGIRLEICWDKKFIKTLQHDEVQLSPVVKFHPNGLQLSKPAQVRIPHSALVFYTNGWQLKLKSSTLHGERIVWKDEDEYQVHNNEVSFQVNYLLSYVVVGASLCNNKPTKKRLQCAVFGGEGRVGVDYTAYLFVFDDCEASLEKIMQEERSNNRILLGSPQSLYVESVTKTDIKISVKQPVDGWIVGEIKPELITHKSLKESYQTIPRAEILFKHDNGRNRDFLCVFELSAENTTTTICAVASIKEDTFRRFQDHQPGFGHDKYRMVTGRNLCDSKLLSSLLQYESDLKTICECLDATIRRRGHYRAVALYYGFNPCKISSVLEKHNEGPSRALIEWLTAAKPELTVREFVTVVRKEAKRNDVADLLEIYDADVTKGNLQDDSFRRFQEHQPGFSHDKHQMVPGRRDLCDSKLLCSLLQHESDDVQNIYDCLDTKIPGLGHYRAVALYYGLGHYQITPRLEKHNEGPTRALIEWLATAKPELTVREFVTVVRKEAKRNDVAKLLEAYDAN